MPRKIILDYRLYCEEKAAPPGSTWYYALGRVAPAQRDALMALQALAVELEAGVDECSESSVAKAKLAWWRTEIERLYQNSPQHPVLQALLPATQAYRLPREELLELVGGAEMNVVHARYNDLAGLRLYAERTGGTLARLRARVLGETSEPALKQAEALGVALALARTVTEAGAHVRKGVIYWPVSELQQFNVPASVVSGLRDTPELAALIRHQLERAQQALHEWMRGLSPEQRKRQRVHLIVARITLATLNEIMRAGAASVLNQRLSLTPLRKLWIATTAR